MAKKKKIPWPLYLVNNCIYKKELIMQCVYGKKIYTGKAVIENAYLIFNQQHIVALAKAPQGERLGEFPVITPAFIDAHSHIGMIRAGEPASEAEGNEHLDSILRRQIGFFYRLER
jgi:imidazolonepropionase-like amidohydrolase